MILFICWVAFVLVLIIAFTVAAVLESRGRESSAVVEEPTDSSYEDSEATEEGEVVEEFEAVEEFSEFPAEGGEPADDFAAFDEEFK
tara:strand:- start:29 stop:289 length:261 start_codon:yes stop_codon:yes gene_type:complete